MFDNRTIAGVLWDIAHLLEIKGENTFKVTAYRNAAELVGNVPDPIHGMSDEALREWPGIGRELALRIREIAQTGDSVVRQQLVTQFPATLLDVLRLPGVGPKTVARLYRELQITSVAELEAAANTGRIRRMKGMGAKKEEAILKAIDRSRQPPAV